MTRAAYFRYATLLPIVVPIGLTALALLALLFGMHPEGLMIVTPILVSGAVMVGPTYLILAGVSLIALRRCSPGWCVAVGLVAPLILAASIPLAMRSLGWTLDQASGEWRSLARWCCGVGYFYVALAFAGLAILVKTGVVD